MRKSKLQNRPRGSSEANQCTSGWSVMRRICLVAAWSFAGAILILSLPFTADLLIGRLEIFPALKDADLQALARGEPTAVVVLAAGRRAYAPEFGTSSGQESVDALTLERVRY